MFTSSLVQRRGQHEAKDSSRTKSVYVVTKMARAVYATSSHLCTTLYDPLHRISRWQTMNLCSCQFAPHEPIRRPAVPCCSRTYQTQPFGLKCHMGVTFSFLVKITSVLDVVYQNSIDR